MTALRLAFVAASALTLAACNATTQAPAPQSAVSSNAQRTSGVTPDGFRLPQGAGCAGEVARFQAIQDNDLATGHVSQSVYDRIKGEIAQADAACSAGRDAEARSLIAASRKRHGYPG